MEDNSQCDKNIFELQGLKDIRKRPDILAAIKLDITPQTVMEPRFRSNPEDMERLKEITGYMLYIETECEQPSLMVMRIGKNDITSTVGKIEEVPSEFIKRALKDPVHKPAFGMYAITDEIREWIKKELGL